MTSKLVAIAAAGLIAAVAACATAPPPLDDHALMAPAHSCYWLSNEGQGWVSRPELADEAQCFEMDSCSGGLGGSGGGCYKWSTAADAPARPWTIRVKPR